MSVIVCSDGVMSADSSINSGDLCLPFPKIWALPTNSAIAGAVGPLQQVALLQQWTQGDMKPENFPVLPNSGTQLLILSKQKGVVRYRGTSTPYLHGHQKLAIGEGAPFAYGALYMGATAEQAVAAAIEYSPHCNGSPISLSL